MPERARAKCYAELRACMSAGIREYYGEFPDRLADVRSVAALEHSMRGLQRILDVLDRYEIRERPAGGRQ